VVQKVAKRESPFLRRARDTFKNYSRRFRGFTKCPFPILRNISSWENASKRSKEKKPGEKWIGEPWGRDAEGRGIQERL